MNGRVEILKVHANKRFADDVKLEDIAKITPGFVGADLENLLNESAILAARESREIITMKDLDEAVDKIGMGTRSKIKNNKTRREETIGISRSRACIDDRNNRRCRSST